MALAAFYCGSRRVGGGERAWLFVIHVEDEVGGCNTILLELIRFRWTPYSMKHGIIHDLLTVRPDQINFLFLGLNSDPADWYLTIRIWLSRKLKPR